MKIKGTFVLFLSSIIASSVAAIFAFGAAESFLKVVPLFAAIITVFIGVSLAVVAVLASPVIVAMTDEPDEADRVKAIVNNQDRNIAGGQVFVFLSYFAALFLIVVFSWMGSGAATNFDEFGIKLLSATTAFFCFFAFFWTTRMPSMLINLAAQRRSL